MRSAYDHKIRELVFASAAPYEVLKEAGVPASTASDWKRKKPREVVTLKSFDTSKYELIEDVKRLELECEQLRTLIDLHGFVNSIFGHSLSWKRLPSPADKALVLESIRSAAKISSLKQCLKTISMSSSRYHSWVREETPCELADYKTCPRKSPLKLTADELDKMQTFVTSADYSHYPLTALAKKKKRSGELICSPSTWSRMIKRYGWVRPRKRVYPAKPKIGVRAGSANEIWHVDVTEVNLLEGGKAYIQSVVDNFSRYTIAWKVSDKKAGIQTKELLREALKMAAKTHPAIFPEVYVDSGSENFNKHVSELIESGKLTLMKAQIEIKFSNSIAEVNFRSLIYNCLYNHPLPNVEKVRELTDFYYGEQNQEMPHSAFKGATPEEMYLSTWTKKDTDEWEGKSKLAMNARVKHHRALRCKKCTL